MEPELKKSNKKTIIIIAAIVAAIALAVGIGVIVYSGSPARRLQEQLDLGARYLSELDYEQAIAAYEAALEIDPKNADAYIGLINACYASGDADGVNEAFEKAQSAGLTEDDMARVEAAYQTAIATLSAGNETGESNTEEAGDAEPEVPPLPEEYREIVNALRELRNMEVLNTPLSEWTRADIEEVIIAEDLEKTVNEYGSSFFPRRDWTAEGNLFYAAFEQNSVWRLTYMLNDVVGLKSIFDLYLTEETEDSDVSYGTTRFVFCVGVGGVDRMDPLSTWEEFFSENGGDAFYNEAVSGIQTKYRIDENSFVLLMPSQMDDGEPMFSIAIYDEKGKILVWSIRQQDGAQMWNIGIGPWDDLGESYFKP